MDNVKLQAKSKRLLKVTWNAT